MNIQHTAIAPLSVLLAGLVLTAACGDGGGKDWDQEVVLQVFKPAQLKLGVVTITATQEGGASRDTRVNLAGQEGFFKDCESNRVRILPTRVKGKYPPVTVTVTAQQSLPAGGVTRVIQVPVSDPGSVVKMILLRGKTYEPTGACASDLGGVKVPRSVGEACQDGADCLGSRCLGTVHDFQKIYTFVQGYCTHSCADTCSSGKCHATGHACKVDGDCRKARCGVGEQCFTTVNGNSQVTDAFCLKQCTRAADCRSNGYGCTAGDVCFPR